MPPRHHVSAAAIERIKRFEGFRRSAARLAAGRWTIGYGHTRSAREGVTIDEADAEALLLYDLGQVSLALNALVFAPLTQNQFDALSSFVLNIGVDEFRRSSVLLRLNEGAILQAASAIELWRKADFEGETIVVDALVRRRAAEKALFLTPDDGFVAMPTPVVRPLLDQAGAPMEPAVELLTPLDGDEAVVQREAEPAPDLIEPFPADPLSEEATSPPVALPTPAPIILPLPDPSSHARRAAEEAWAVERVSIDPFPMSPPADALGAPMGEAEASRASEFGRRPLSRPDLDPGPWSPASYWPLGVMLVVGVVLLAVATYWFVAAHPGMGAAATSVIGWVLGLVGIGLLASSIYFLLERIGARDED